MKAIVFLIAVSALAQTTNQGVINRGQSDSSQSTVSLPHRTGTGSPNSRDNCAKIGETFFQTDAATPGTNSWACTATGSPGTWTQQGISTTGGAQSNFASSSGCVVSSSATPAFNFADITGPKSCTVVSFTPTVNVTAPTFTNTTKGAVMAISITTDGTHTFTWNNTIASNACNPDTGVATTTTAIVQIAPDGTTVNGIGCTGGNAGTLAVGPFGSSPSATPAAGNIRCNAVATGIDCLSPAGVHYSTPATATVTHNIQIPITGNPIVTGTSGAAISTSTSFACTNFTNVTIDGNASGSMTANVLKNGGSISASAPVTLATQVTNNNVDTTGWTTIIAPGDKWSANVLSADGVLIGVLITITCQ